MAPGETIIVDPYGDVFLSCGTNAHTVKIQVSSHVLSLCSPVFRSMLGPHFKEGNALTTSATVDIPLPKDDPKTVVNMCRVLHLRNEEIAAKMNEHDILKLALLADKYECINAFIFSAQIWIEALLEDAEEETLCTLFAAAYYFQHRLLFERLSRDLILRSLNGLWHATQKPAETDPENFLSVLALLEEAVQKTTEEASQIIEDAIYECIPGTKPDTYPRCLCPDLDLSNLMCQLSSQGLWPVGAMSCENLATTFQRMKSLSLTTLDHIRCQNGLCKNINVRPQFEDSALSIRAKAEELENNIQRICYRCVKAGTVSFKNECECGS